MIRSIRCRGSLSKALRRTSSPSSSLSSLSSVAAGRRCLSVVALPSSKVSSSDIHNKTGAETVTAAAADSQQELQQAKFRHGVALMDNHDCYDHECSLFDPAKLAMYHNKTVFTNPRLQRLEEHRRIRLTPKGTSSSTVLQELLLVPTTAQANFSCRNTTSRRRLLQQLQKQKQQHALYPFSPPSSLFNPSTVAASYYWPAATASCHQYQQVVFFSTKNATASSTAAELQDMQHIPKFVTKRKYLSTTSGGGGTTTSTTTASGGGRRNTLGTTKVPTPLSAVPPEDPKQTAAAIMSPKRLLDLMVSFSKTIMGFLMRLPGNIFFYVTHPEDFRLALASIKKTAQDEIHHYWVGFKLFWAEIQTARSLMSRTLEGTPLTRRERKQLLRTISDLFRMVPFSMFIIIPFMEFALPFALRLFPNMLPSTFQDSLKAEENMKRELQSRIAMAQFFQETLEELAKEQKRKAAKRKTELAEAGGISTSGGDDSSNHGDGSSVDIHEQEDSAASMLEFLSKARNGEMIPPDVIVRYANYFHDDLTLDNMPRMQLINMCKYMSIPPYGSEAFLRFQLRHKVRVLKEDDQRILWEGIDSLTKMELREACQERGMRSTGLSKDAYKQSLQQWLDLSVHKSVPISLLIMSRIFFLRDEMFDSLKANEGGSKSLFGLADAISGLDKEVLDQVILEVATPKEKKSDPDIRKLKLEVVSKQNELIRQEQAARDAKAKRKEVEKADEAAAAPVTSQATEAMQMTTDVPDPFQAATALMETKATTTTATATSTIDARAAATATEEQPRERDLSTAEMDAISQLVSDDPVSMERAELERIKAAIRTERPEGKVSLELELKPPLEPLLAEGAAFPSGDASVQPTTAGGKTDRVPPIAVSGIEEPVIRDAKSSGVMTPEAKHVDSHQAEEEDPLVAGLKRRVESMVDKIEVQMSQVQVRIGDRLHFLDKDRDGVLTREEMADVLQQVLKRKISFEEAMEIAGEMDENQDGAFTVREMIRWMDKNKLVKAAEEGRDADMDRIMESQATEAPKDEGGGISKP